MTREIFSKLRYQGLRHRLGLAECFDLRQVADEALSTEIYTPSLVDAALDADETLYEIGAAFEKALEELAIVLPESAEGCCWKLLSHYINQIKSGVIEPHIGLRRIMEVYYGCNSERTTTYFGDLL